jgi:hypothetical protein
VSVDLYFAVPLIVRDVDPAVREAIRKKVSAYLKSESAKRTVAPSPEESVATSFYRREASILADAGLEELEAIVFSTAKAYLERTLNLPPRKLEIEHAWINRRPGRPAHTRRESAVVQLLRRGAGELRVHRVSRPDRRAPKLP